MTGFFFNFFPCVSLVLFFFQLSLLRMSWYVHDSVQWKYSGFHFLCSKLWTVADTSSFAPKLCRMLEKICRGVPSSPISKRIRKKEARFLANPFSSFPTFAGAALGCYNVTNPHFSVDLLTCQAAPMGYNSVSLGWVYSWVSLSVWSLAAVRPAFTDKIRLTGWEMLRCLCWLLFQ